MAPLDYKERCEKLQGLPERSIVFIPKTERFFEKKTGEWQDFDDAWIRKVNNVLAVHEFEIILDTTKETNVNILTPSQTKDLLDHLAKLPLESVVYLNEKRSFFKKIGDYSWFNAEISEQVRPDVLVQMGDFDVVRVGGINEWFPKVGKFAQLAAKVDGFPSSVQIVQVMALSTTYARVHWVGKPTPDDLYSKVVDLDLLIDPMTGFYAEGEFWQAYRRQAEKGNVLDTNQ